MSTMLNLLRRLRRNQARALTQSRRRRRPGVSRADHRPSIEALEDRFALVIGAFDIPGPIAAGDGYDGVALFNVATGALLSMGRHLLTAAHTEFPGSTSPAVFVVQRPNDPESIVSIATPGAGFIRHPNFPNPARDYDIGVQPLAELAPLTASMTGHSTARQHADSTISAEAATSANTIHGREFPRTLISWFFRTISGLMVEVYEAQLQE